MTAPRVEWHVAVRALGGESGDQYCVRRIGEGVLVAVVDGLGHGAEAAHAARTAIGALEAAPELELAALLARCHDSLRGTRGAVLSLAWFGLGSMAWLGVGNVDGVLLRSGFGAPEHLLVRGGVVGHRLPSLEATRLGVRRGDTLIVSTDGIEGRFAGAPDVAFAAPPTAERILLDYGKGTDDALVMVVRYLGPSEE